MKRFTSVLLTLITITFSSVAAQMEEGGLLIWEKYTGINGPIMTEYFQMVKDKYAPSTGNTYGLYGRSPTIGYRVTPVQTGGLEGVQEILTVRQEVFGEFTDAEVELWEGAWTSRETMILANVPDLSLIPDDFGVLSVADNPFVDVLVYFLKPQEIQTFRESLARRNELDRELGADNYIMRVYQGMIGTPSPAFLVMQHYENMTDLETGRARRMQARQSVPEWMEVQRRLMGSAREIERFILNRNNELSFSANR